MEHDDRHDGPHSPDRHETSHRHRRDYLVAARLARTHAPDAATALAVGPSDPTFLDSIDWVRSRTSSDVVGDPLRFEPPGPFDLIFCLRNLERFPRPVPFLGKLLQAGQIVVVSVPCSLAHNPADELKLQRWARRRWIDSDIVEGEEHARLIAVFRGGDVVTADFGESREDREWLDDLTASIDSVRLPRRRPRFAAPVPARLDKDDPLRSQITGSFGVYAVRALWKALGFDEHRKFRWRLEHKLVQSRVFNHYLGHEFPTSWGVGSLLRRGLRGPLIDAILSDGVFAKEALGHLSGDFGEAEATHEILENLFFHSAEPPRPETPIDEKWIVQERIAVEREYRVHSFEDVVLPGMTFDRYGPGSVPEGREEVNSYVESLLARLPDALVGESLYAWDVARLAGGRYRVIEVNLVGFHPVYERGFQASGFFQYHPHGPPLLAELLGYAEATYHVQVELSDDWEGEPNRDTSYLRVLRHYLGRRPISPTGSAVVAPAGPPPDRLDAVLSVRAEEFGRFALLRESIAATGAPIGTLWVAVPDADLTDAAATLAFAPPGCVVVAESELVPELADLPDVPPGVRRQVARLALVARTGGDYCFDMSADVVSTRRFRTADLVRSGKAFYSRTIGTTHAERYERAEDLLNLRRSGWVHGTTPYLFSKRAVAELIDYLGGGTAGASSGRGSWRRFLLGQRGWALGQVYFTFLEAFGLEERDYFPGEWDLYDNCIWSSDDWDEWDPSESFGEYNSHYFSVVQVGSAVTAEAVRRRLAPYLGLV